MKIRIKDSSIRLRLSQDDIATLKENDEVSASCQWAINTNWVYQITKGTENKVIFSHEGVKLSLVAEHINKVISETEVGTSLCIDNNTEEGLKILVEKDFQCLIPRSENESNLYANPKA